MPFFVAITVILLLNTIALITYSENYWYLANRLLQCSFHKIINVFFKVACTIGLKSVKIISFAIILHLLFSINPNKASCLNANGSYLASELPCLSFIQQHRKNDCLISHKLVSVLMFRSSGIRFLRSLWIHLHICDDDEFLQWRLKKRLTSVV